MRKIESKINNYYRNRKERKRLSYEINLLEKSLRELESCRTVENAMNIDAREKSIKKRLIEKRLKLNELISETMGMEAFVVMMNKEDKELCDLRYDRGLCYQEISKIMHISNSTISRRLNSILGAINI